MYEKNSNWFYVLKKLFEKVMSQGYGNEFSMYFSFTQFRMFLTFYFFDIQCFCLFWAQNITMEGKPKIERELTKLLANKQTNCPLPSYLLFFYLNCFSFGWNLQSIDLAHANPLFAEVSKVRPFIHIDERERRSEKVHKKEIVKRFKSLRRRKTERWMKSIHDYKRQIRFFCYTFRIDGHKQIINIFFGVLRFTLTLIHKSAYIKSKFSPFLFFLSFCLWPFVSEQQVDTFRVHIT